MKHLVAIILFNVLCLTAIVAGALMFFSLYHIPPFRGREWQIALIIGAIFEIVPAFRMKEDK